MGRFRVPVLVCCLLAAGSCGGSGPQRESAAQTSTAATATAAAVPAAAAPTPAGSAWVDPTYTPQTNVLAALAIVPPPFVGAHATEIDEGLERAFLETPGSQLRGQPGIIRQRMNGNRGFLLLIEQIRAIEYTPADLPRANLDQVLTAKQLIDLRASMNSSSMLVVPVEFVIEPGASATGGYVLYRVYDLEAGKLLLQSRLERRVAAGGDSGRTEATIQLILAMQSDFAKRLMPR